MLSRRLFRARRAAEAAAAALPVAPAVPAPMRIPVPGPHLSGRTRRQDDTASASARSAHAAQDATLVAAMFAGSQQSVADSTPASSSHCGSSSYSGYDSGSSSSYSSFDSGSASVSCD